MTLQLGEEKHGYCRDVADLSRCVHTNRQCCKRHACHKLGKRSLNQNLLVAHLRARFQQPPSVPKVHQHEIKHFKIRKIVLSQILALKRGSSRAGTNAGTAAAQAASAASDAAASSTATLQGQQCRCFEQQTTVGPLEDLHTFCMAFSFISVIFGTTETHTTAAVRGSVGCTVPELAHIREPPCCKQHHHRAKDATVQERLVATACTSRSVNQRTENTIYAAEKVEISRNRNLYKLAGAAAPASGLS